MGMCMSIDEETLEMEFGCKVMEKRRERERRTMEVLSQEAEHVDLLSRIPSRLVSNGLTNSCCLYTKHGTKGVNQDCMVVWEGFNCNDNDRRRDLEEDKSGVLLCGVFDGHGPDGHHVARRVRDGLPSLLLNTINNNNLVNEPNNPTSATTNHSPPPNIEEAFIQAYGQMDDTLKSHPKIKSMYSGTTALIMMIVKGKEMVVGNVGDSRAILAKRHEDGTTLVVEQLTVDLKPNVPGELERIEACEGRVFALGDEPSVARIWMPHSSSPGLAMSRALGDFCIKNHGLISTPIVSHYDLTPQHEFIVLATDGVWDVLSNEEVLEIVTNCSLKEAAAKSIVDTARKRWKRKEYAMEAKTDDCAVICYFLHETLDPSLNIANMKTPKKGKRKSAILDFRNVNNKKNVVLQRGDTNRDLNSFDHSIVTIEETPNPTLLENVHLERGV